MVALSILAEVAEIECGVISDSLALSDSALSKHLRVLDNAGYIALREGIVGSRTRTWVNLTKAGRTAFRAHVRALTSLAVSADMPELTE